MRVSLGRGVACPSYLPAAGADPGRRKAPAYGAHDAQSFAATSAPPATPIADMVEAMLSGGAAAAGAQTVNQNAPWLTNILSPIRPKIERLRALLRVTPQVRHDRPQTPAQPTG
jgi:hypothetical protein